MNKISAVIITYNEEFNIGRCIDSLRPVVDEIIVVDCFSTDGTQKVCLEKEVKFFQHEFIGFAFQKNYAVSLASFDYVLSLDADECLSEELTQSIQAIRKGKLCDGYTMNRLSSYAGKWIRTCGWYPDTKLRLWNKNLGTWVGRGIHEKVELNEKTVVKHLKGDLLHLAYNNISQFLEKIQRYSAIYGREHRFRIHVNSFKIIYKTVFSFIKSYFIKLGIADGYKGLLISACNANFVFYKYLTLLEANRVLSTSLIISTYNREDALELTLISVLNQSVMPNEIIIADDGSRSATKSVIDRYRLKFPVPVKHIWHEDTGFRAGQIRNKAIAKATSEYIISVDGDMVLHKDFIRLHKKAAWKGRFIQGSRVLLSNKKTELALQSKVTNFFVLESGISNRINAIFFPPFSSLFTVESKKLEGTRTCNMAFWKKDFVEINGFNEDIVGWGREDTEMAVRLMNNGVKRVNLKFGGFGYHLYHKENSRSQLIQNDKILRQTIDAQLRYCGNGITKYLNGSNNIKVDPRLEEITSK